MSKKLLKNIAILGITAVGVAACTTFSDEQLSMHHGEMAAQEQTGAESHSVDVETGFYEDVAANEQSGVKDNKLSKADLRNIHAYYFEFDKYQLDSHDENSLLAHAKYLSEHPKAHIRLEGHTDERGSREYNVTLGEHRAEVVKNFLLAHGAQTEQVDIVSFGKEKPVELEHNEHAWQKNRRTVVVYEHS